MAARLKNLPAGKPARRIPANQSLDELTAALERAFTMSPEDALAVAGVVVERFQGKDEVNDEEIDAEVRSLFYTLQGKGLLSFRRVEYDNENGEKRRAFWWRMRPEVVQELSAPEALPLEEDVYAALPAECWHRAGGDAAAKA